LKTKFKEGQVVEQGGDYYLLTTIDIGQCPEYLLVSLNTGHTGCILDIEYLKTYYTVVADSLAEYYGGQDDHT